MQLRGLIDTGKETERLRSKEEKIATSLAKLKESMSIEDYEQKVPADVQLSHEERLKQLNGELEKVTVALQGLSTIG